MKELMLEQSNLHDAEEKNLFESTDTNGNNVKEPLVRNLQHMNLVIYASSPR